MIDLRILYLIISLTLSSSSIAIALRQYNIEKSKSIMIAIYLNLILLMSFFMSNFFSESIISIVNYNINFIMTLIGMALVYTGYNFILDYKMKFNEDIDNSKSLNNLRSLNNPITLNNSKSLNNSNIIFSLKRKIQKNLTLVLLFISYFITILINAIYVAPIMWISIFELGLMIAVISFLLIVIFYIISQKKIKLPKKLYKGIFGFFLSLTGILYFVLYVFIPNLQNILTEKMTPLLFPEANLIRYIIIIGIIFIISGFFIKKSNRFKNFI